MQVFARSHDSMVNGWKPGLVAANGLPLAEVEGCIWQTKKTAGAAKVTGARSRSRSMGPIAAKATEDRTRTVGLPNADLGSTGGTTEPSAFGVVAKLAFAVSSCLGKEDTIWYPSAIHASSLQKIPIQSFD